MFSHLWLYIVDEQTLESEGTLKTVGIVAWYKLKEGLDCWNVLEFKSLYYLIDNFKENIGFK